MSGLLTPEEWRDIADRAMRGETETAVADRQALISHMVAVADQMRALPQWLEITDGHVAETIERQKALRLLLPCACPEV